MRGGAAVREQEEQCESRRSSVRAGGSEGKEQQQYESRGRSRSSAREQWSCNREKSSSVKRAAAV